jgi:hypothetical protein
VQAFIIGRQFVSKYFVVVVLVQHLYLHGLSTSYVGLRYGRPKPRDSLIACKFLGVMILGRFILNCPIGVVIEC